MTKLPDEMTLGEARQLLRDNFKPRVKTACPCCTQLVTLYPTKLDYTMAVSLIGLYRKGDGYHHISEFDAWTKGYAGGKFAKVKHWGFADTMPNDDPKKRTSGMWQITAKGKLFVEEEVMVQSHALLFNKNFYGYSGDKVGIQDVLGEKFDYSELMGWNDTL